MPERPHRQYHADDVRGVSERAIGSAGKLTKKNRLACPGLAGPPDTAICQHWSIASANVDLVPLDLRGLGARDFSSVEWAHPEIEFVVADGLSPGSRTGLAGLADGWREFLSAWENWRVEAYEYREIHDERVLVLVHSSGRGKVSGLEIGQPRVDGAQLFHVRSGKVTRLVLYRDREHLFADLGLAP